MMHFAAVGNDLYTGKRSVDFVGRRKTWYLFSGFLLALAVLGLVWHGLNLGLEFRGGSEFRVPNVSAAAAQNYEAKAKDAVGSVQGGTEASVTKLGSGTVRVQTEKLNDAESANVRTALAKTFHTPENQVSASFVGPSWGASVSQKALKALIVFLLLVSLLMAAYFRTWKMAVSGLVALLHDLVITVGIYALFGFEITPASMIGFLTILGYSLYDTVVVFDKVRENTAEAMSNGRMSYAQAANLGVNQTLVRSINTTVVALLPIAAVLVVGFTLLGPGTLLDLSLALFVGIGVGAYSSIFIATPLLVHLRKNEPAVQELARRAAKYQARNPAPLAEDLSAARLAEAAGEPAPGEPAPGEPAPGEPAPGEELVETAATRSASAPSSGATAIRPGQSTGRPGGRQLHPYAQSGPRNQPKRPPKSRR